MVDPAMLASVAAKKEDENYRFRRYLKNRADEDELDRQFLALHEELFADYDCSLCRNCCRMNTSLETEDIWRISEYLNIPEDEFRTRFLAQDTIGYELVNPCPFLHEDGVCGIEDCKPEECKGFPYTDRPGRLWSLLNIVSFAGVCPVVFEILEWPKDLYHFRR